MSFKIAISAEGAAEIGGVYVTGEIADSRSLLCGDRGSHALTALCFFFAMYPGLADAPCAINISPLRGCGIRRSLWCDVGSIVGFADDGSRGRDPSL